MSNAENCPSDCGHVTFDYCGHSGTHCDKHCICSCSLCVKARRRGKFIVFEGLDGAGTTTQRDAVLRQLTAQGRLGIDDRTELAVLPTTRSGMVVRSTAEPSTGPAGVLIRSILNREVRIFPGSETARLLAELFAMDREHHLRTVITPALEAGHHVLCDRYILSSLAYQDDVSTLVEERNASFLAADLTLFVAVSAEVAAARRQAAGRKNDLLEDITNQQRVEGNYEAAIAGPWGRRENVRRIQGEQPPQAVLADCLRYINELLAGGEK